jgi:hypothetical protein
MTTLPWETDLDALKSDGWSYGYVKVKDQDTGRELWLVDISRNGARYSVKAPTIEDAVGVLYGFATTAEIESNEVH